MQGTATLFSQHQQWWHAYYPASFVTLADTRLESFYWINMYKLASGTRGDRVVYDLMGPWFVGESRASLPQLSVFPLLTQQTIPPGPISTVSVDVHFSLILVSHAYCQGTSTCK